MRSPRLLQILLFCAAAVVGAGCGDEATFDPLEPILTIDPLSLDMGDVEVGTIKETRIRLANDGDAVLMLRSLERGAVFDASFSFEVDRMAVGPRQAAFITVRFAPTAVGPKSASLIVHSVDLPDQEVQIRGAGVTARIEVEPQSLSFGNVVILTKKTLGVIVRNVGPIDADVTLDLGSNVKLCSDTTRTSVTFCLTPTTRPIDAESAFVLGPSEETTLEVSFSPAIAGTRERGSFQIQSGGVQTTVNLDGVGIEDAFRCEPESIDFGLVNPGSCLTRTVACENIANEQITIVDWGASIAGGPPTSPAFRIEAFPGPVVLAERDRVEIDVTYCPADLRDDRGRLVIETDNPDPRRKFAEIELEGTGGGPDIDVTPLVLNFGQVSLIAPARRTISVQNLGFEPLEVREITVDTLGTMSFTAPGAAGQSLPSGAFLEITIEFQPREERVIESELLIRTNDQDEPEVRVRLVGEGVNLPPCAFEVVPENLSFGAVERARMISRSFEIRNTGVTPCLVTAIRLLPGSDPEFSLPDGDLSSTMIPGGAAAAVRVQYAPTSAGTHRGEVEFSISSPTSPFNVVELSGTGAESALLIVPNDLDFGVIEVGCAARTRTIQIFNTGVAAARINSISLASPSNPAFSIVSLPTPLPGAPIDLVPGASTAFEVGFRADLISAYTAAIQIEAAIGNQAVTYFVSLSGDGAEDAIQVDEFEQLGRPRVDILFVVDDSCSMQEEQTSLSSNFEAFIQFASAQEIDYHLAVTTTDVDEGRPPEMGRFVPVTGPAQDRVVTPLSQPSPEALFSQNANVGIDNFTGTEKGLEAAYLALSNPLISTHNANFLRQDAVLSLIIVSDEEDSSPRSVDFYVNFFQSIKGFRNTNLFTASSIVGDMGGCSGGGGAATPGLRYIDVAARTGGVFQSICTADWSRALEELSTTAFGFKSRFFLSNQPAPGSIRVYLDGVELPARVAGGTVNWTYDFPSNSVNFTPFSTPEPGARIRVEYAVDCL